jgi:hypothetical protein
MQIQDTDNFIADHADCQITVTWLRRHTQGLVSSLSNVNTEPPYRSIGDETITLDGRYCFCQLCNVIATLLRGRCRTTIHYWA